MAKENKSTTILLLVVAGALLFLVGSFTGNIIGRGLTTQQKQSVLNMLNKDCALNGIPFDGTTKTCNDACSYGNSKAICVFGIGENKIEDKKDELITCNQMVGPESSILPKAICMCCKA